MRDENQQQDSGSSSFGIRKPGSAVEKQLQYRRARGWLFTIFFVVVLGPLLPVLFFIAWPSSGLEFGIVGSLLSGLSFLLPMTVAAIFLMAFFSIVIGKRRTGNSPGVQRAANPELAGIIAEIGAARAKLAAARRQYCFIAVPFGGVGGAVIGALMVGGPATVISGLVGGTVGYVGVTALFKANYSNVFKEMLLPRLLSRYGSMERRHDYRPDLVRAVATGIVQAKRQVIIDDAFTGIYRGHPVEISEIGLTRHTRSVVMVTLNVERPLLATTAVVNVSFLDNEGRSSDSRLARTMLEDVVFSKVYAVYSTDEIGARAILTPAVMEAMLTMSDRSDFMPPTLLAEGNRLQFAFHTYADRNLFEPMEVTNSDIGSHILSVETDLEHLFKLVDLIIDATASLHTIRQRQ